MEVFQNLPIRNEETSGFIKIAESQDWIVREKAYLSFPYFLSGKTREKKYYDIFTSKLDEKNPKALKELFKTLVWYDKKRSFRHLYNRSLRYNSIVEFILMLRELSVYSNRRMLARFKKIAKTHPNFLVREEAKRILKEVYKR